jgi:Gpi18-like mannosyltransferase
MDRRSPASLAPYAVGAVVVVLSALLHARLWPFVAPDMNDYLLPWYRHIEVNGPVHAFAAPFANYTPTYLYLLAAGSLAGHWVPALSVIKALSVLGTLFLAAAMAQLLKASGAASAKPAAMLVLLLPTPLLNAAFLGQCDAYWVACCLLSLAAALSDRPRTMLVWAGLAVGFKAQAAFFAPVAIGLLLQRRAPWHWWLIPPAVYAAAMAPAWLVGWPAADLATIYLRQAGELDALGNAANPWVVGRVFAPALFESLVTPGLVAAAAAALALCLHVAKRVGREGLLEAALLSALLLPWLLPKMHERYFMLADMLSFALAVAQPSRRTLVLAVLVQGSSLLALIAYTQPTPVPVLVGAALSTAALAMLILPRRRATMPTLTPASA